MADEHESLLRRAQRHQLTDTGRPLVRAFVRRGGYASLAEACREDPSGVSDLLDTLDELIDLDDDADLQYSLNPNLTT